MGTLMSGKRGIVFGVANQKSIAWGCAERLAAEGATLAFNFLGEAQERRVRDLVGATDWSKAGTGSPLVFPCDVTLDDDIASFYRSVRSQWDSVDFVIHSVAYTEKECLRNPFVQTSRENFARTLDVSAYSLVAVVREAGDLLKPGSSIVSMSYYGAEKVVPKYNVMGVAKAALESCTKYLAYDLGSQGIRVNALSAGPIRTLSSSAIPGIREMLENAQRYAPLKRNVTQEDISNSALYLLSSLSSGVTGEVLHVDCGYNTLGMFETVPDSL
jgi:enoyl-[acyl-carrier protein] reductase I